MQALTLSIGQAGIDYFSRQFFASQLVNLLEGLALPDRTIAVGDFLATGVGWSDSYSDINVYLTSGTLQGFTPAYQGVKQLASGQPAGSQFQIAFGAGAFTAQYNWHETGSDYFCSSSGHGTFCHGNQIDNTFQYAPRFDSITVQVTTAFTYDKSSNTYLFTGVGSTATTGTESPNIPGGSVLQNEDSECFSSHVSSATSAAVSAIDFTGTISGALPSLLKTVQGSGDLGNGIAFGFALGDSGMAFSTVSGQNGVSIGVTGTVSYEGAAYPGAAPQGLPMPPVPASTSTNHLQTYVSDYSVNGLQWAYFKAGLLTTTATPGTVPDPRVLKCATYVASIPAFKPYAMYGMQAAVTPLAAPVTTFQQVWEFTQDAVNALQKQLPTNVWNILNTAMIGNSYLSSKDLDDDLAAYGVPTENVTAIANATVGMGMVVVHDLQFVLTILDGASPQPTITFSVQRTDIQTRLSLGVTQVAGSKAQTMQFAYLNNSYAATFVSSTVPKFPDGEQFADIIWPQVGEPAYDNVLAAMGKAGVPIPIMSGFNFVFGGAQLSVQEGYVSIQAQIEAS